MFLVSIMIASFLSSLSNILVFFASSMSSIDRAHSVLSRLRTLNRGGIRILHVDDLQRDAGRVEILVRRHPRELRHVPDLQALDELCDLVEELLRARLDVRALLLAQFLSRGHTIP